MRTFIYFTEKVNYYFKKYIHIYYNILHVKMFKCKLCLFIYLYTCLRLVFSKYLYLEHLL